MALEPRPPSQITRYDIQALSRSQVRTLKATIAEAAICQEAEARYAQQDVRNEERLIEVAIDCDRKIVAEIQATLKGTNDPLLHDLMRDRAAQWRRLSARAVERSQRNG
jgi:hypothetical protein